MPGPTPAPARRGALAPEVFRSRHRVIRLITFLLVPLVVVTGLASGTLDGSVHTGDQSAWVVAFAATALACAAFGDIAHGQRGRAVCVAIGLDAAVSALVQAIGGSTHLHLAYLVAVALVGLYQDWVPLLLSVLLIFVHHLAFGALAPQLIYSDGTPHHLALPLALLHGALVLAMCAVQMVHWHFARASEAALRRSHEETRRLALVARRTADGIVITDAHGVVEWANEAFYRMTGLSPSRVEGRTRTGLFPEPLAPEHAAALDPATALASSAARGPVGGELEFRTSTAAGRPYWTAIEVHPVTEAGVTRFFLVERDVTARHEAEQELLRARERAEALTEELSHEKFLLSDVISSIPQLLYWKDNGGRYRGANQALLDELGVSAADEVIGRTDTEIGLVGPLAEGIRSVERQIDETGLAVMDQHVSLPAWEGPPRSFLLSVLPQHGPDGARTGLIGVGADVSRVADLERALAQANRLEALGQLAAGVAHEINTPVQFVSDNTSFLAESFGELLTAAIATRALLTAATAADATGSAPAAFDLEAAVAVDAALDMDFLTEEVPKAIAESQEGLGRVAGIVRALKDFSHPGAGRGAVDVNRAIESTAHISRSEWKYEAELDLDLDPELGLVPCYESELKQVVLNLIVNAAHAVSERRATAEHSPLGRITVSTRRDGDQVTISVADNGTGMDEGTKLRIFEPFFTTKEVGRGTGQGLSLAYNVVVQLHGGRIDVDTHLGEGTVFTLTLPLDAVPADGSAPQAVFA
ncbi:sensor histidine kinase [Actinosynnema pretiosum]|uniref:histidine kinase n=2 Tax=Actinosynnema TaxID=40566 RepID=A0A290Z4I2_9PSEU|nr:ATP-binding protein [Actinosynnema pretiosum]ATE53940.1 hypothetical protein CNX65_12055 [Actinosynnema pretiosum]